MEACIPLLIICAAPGFAGASGAAAAVDTSGNVWFTGTGLTIATTANAFQRAGIGSTCATQQTSPFEQPTSVVCSHAYVIKHDATGKILYATNLGGRSQDGGIAITTDAQGNAYVTGYTYSPDFPVTSGVAQGNFAGPAKVSTIIQNIGPFGPVAVLPGGDTFVAKFAPDGTLIYSTLLGGSGSDVPASIAVDTAGNAYVEGTTSSTDFPVTGNGLAHQPQSGNFFARLNAQATAFSYATYSDATIQAFDVDGQGNAYLTGVAAAGAYVTEIATASGQVVHSASLPGLNAKFTGAGAAIALGNGGTIHLGVSPAPAPSPLLIHGPNLYPLGASFLLQLSADAGSVLAETDLAATQIDSISLDSAGNVYAVGHGNPTLPSAATAPLLAGACTTAGGSFVVEWNAAGNLSAATYLRQGSGLGAAVSSPGHLVIPHGQAQSAIALDLTLHASTNFGCLLNLATGSTGLGIAPGEIFTVSGTGIGPAQAAVATPDAAGHYPTSVGGAQVLIGGTPAPLLYAQAREIHGVVPVHVSGTPTIVVQYNQQSGPALDIPRTEFNPGVFSSGGQAAILNQDGRLNTPSNPAKAGSIVSVYGTGTGVLYQPDTSPLLQNPLQDGQITPIPPPFFLVRNPPTASIGGVSARVVWVGSAPALIVGVTQINVEIPAEVKPSARRLTLVIASPGVAAPPVSIDIAP